MWYSGMRIGEIAAISKPDNIRFGCRHPILQLQYHQPNDTLLKETSIRKGSNPACTTAVPIEASNV